MKTHMLVLCCVVLCGELEAKLVDLTHLTDENTPYYPFYFPFNLTIMYRGWGKVGDGTNRWFEYNKLSLPEHIGTHMDAPAHHADGPGYWRVHQIPIDHFIGDAVVIDISYRADLVTNPDAIMTVDDLGRWEEKYGRIRDGSIVFCYSGWDQYINDEAKYLGNADKNTSNFHWPGFGPEASQWLVDNRNIVGVGSDTMGFGAGSATAFPEHVILLSQNIYGLENVNNLGKIPEHGARVSVFPMRIRDGSGTPTRIIAEFDSEYVPGPEPPGSTAAPVMAGSSLIKWLSVVVMLLLCFK